jgi:carboxymethylenebutenolidase
MVFKQHAKERNMSGTHVNIKGPDGTFSGYLARPASGKGPGIVVIQEIFGVNAVMRAIADGLAEQGYVALVPDLFWRIEPGIDITDKTQAEWDKAFSLFGAFNTDTGVIDIQATIDHLRTLEGVSGKVGAVGYCLGGLLAYLTATRTDIDASVSYYGVGIEGLLAEAGHIKKPLLMHIARKDQFVPADAQAAIEAALGNHRQVTLYAYEGQDHAFAREGGAHYDAAAAQSANGRTAAFFKTHLG